MTHTNLTIRFNHLQPTTFRPTGTTSFALRAELVLEGAVTTFAGTETSASASPSAAQAGLDPAQLAAAGVA